jgi:hypothetical protein
VSVTDEDLKLMPKLQLIGLSHNAQITNKGIKYLPNLISASLFGNSNVSSDMQVFAQTNPRLVFIENETFGEHMNADHIQEEIYKRCAFSLAKI